ncbi:alpha-1,6-glucosidase domain-containing protein [Pseudoduganella sp. GCM10020061]|uniref:alpha-1,6-glucosidase domain-containing protein n=1 Tax=Pseudoduganella sp. GCM10020061 TaxID=3317345 RepID=UPI00362F1A57
MPRSHIAILAASAALANGAFAHTIEECNSTDFATVLKAAPARMDARAVWLDQRSILWPGGRADAFYKLYHSPDAAISAPVGGKVTGAAGVFALPTPRASITPPRFSYLGSGMMLQLDGHADSAALMRGQLVVVAETADGTVLDATGVQMAPAIDQRFADAAQVPDLGVSVSPNGTGFKLWAPTAQRVSLCTYPGGSAKAAAIVPMTRNDADGVWTAASPSDLSGAYYKYIVDVVVPNAGVVRNRVTDPYSVSHSADSRRSYVADLDSPRLKPAGWDAHRAPATVKSSTDMVIYELHVRDFSLNDATVPAAHRGKYAAFGATNSNGMKHLRALAKAGMTDIHLLPVFDIGSVPEVGCAVPSPSGAPDSPDQQALIEKTKEVDCFNWGYDPYHFNAPEGSYATQPGDGAARVRELRKMVMDLHRAGLRVGMDVVYNHTFIGGQEEKSVLDRVVPGYYHRLNATGAIERSTCCDNTATENLMMGKLMIESAVLWTRHYKMDSFRFDLMGHQPRAAMEELQRRVNAAAGHPVQLIGEGWNFGEVADGKRFVQASQLSLNGTGIGTFSDRTRDAVRGGSAGDSGKDMLARQGYVNGLVYDANAHAPQRSREDLMRTADMVRVGLAGSQRTYPLQTYSGEVRQLQHIDYNGQPAGYASMPSEAVNYVENHDNHTLYDINVFRLPVGTSTADRARVQMLAAAINAFSQGVAYYHAGIDTLRSKSLDRNSFNSGDWFNRIDWTYRDNYFGTGLPPAEDNGKDYPLLQPLLANPALKPAPADISFARDAFRDLLAIRASTTLFRMANTRDIEQRLKFWNTGTAQEPTVLAAHIDGKGYPGARFGGLAYFVNVDKKAHVIPVAEAKGRNLRLHPVHARGADQRAREARYDAATGTFTIPARTAVVFVE